MKYTASSIMICRCYPIFLFSVGHLAHEIGTDDIGSVVMGGGGLDFISYLNDIAKFENSLRIFSLLFFLMLFVLGIGCNIRMNLIIQLFNKYPHLSSLLKFIYSGCARKIDP
uniref:Uncharacterized protein n=1 Tax=Glossina palpalis gambiensis TaxID=67801 RepID=A0A1B0C7T8_9MUSC